MTINKSRKLFFAISAAIFGLMLICNFFTGLYSDDFAYCFSFATKQRITSIADIFPSIYAHGRIMNGRAVAHFFVQLFLLLPLPLFKLVNSAMFLLQILLIYRICTGDKHNNLLLLGIFTAIWYFEPAFGQVNLWLDGSCNYLWSITVGLIFLMPYINRFLYGKSLKSPAAKVFFVLIGFSAGGYLENASAAVILTALLLIAEIKFIRREKIKLYEVLGFVLSIGGYLFMATAPGTLKNKAAEMSLNALRLNFMTALDMFKTFMPLQLAFVLLLITAIYIKTDKNKILLAVTFAIGALCANFILTAASYYPERCAFCSVVLLVAADAVLVNLLAESKYKLPSVCLIAAVIFVSGYNICVGLNDIYSTNAQLKSAVSYIYECKNAGIADVKLPMIESHTKYSAVHDLKYLDTEDSSTWPNYSMSRYYGINSVIGQ